LSKDLLELEKLNTAKPDDLINIELGDDLFKRKYKVLGPLIMERAFSPGGELRHKSKIFLSNDEIAPKVNTDQIDQTISLRETGNLYNFKRRAKIGMKLEEIDGRFIVVDVIENSVAHKAGVGEGYSIWRINNNEVKTQSELFEAIQSDEVTIDFLTLLGEERKISLRRMSALSEHLKSLE